MIIKCKKTKRFLCKIDIESYLLELEKLGIEQNIPLKIVVPCRNCKESEIYEVYRHHYIFIGNKRRDENG